MVHDGRIEIPVSSSNGLSRTAPAGWIAMSPGSRPPSTEPLQLVAPGLPVDLPVGGKVKHWEFIGIRHPHER